MPENTTKPTETAELTAADAAKLVFREAPKLDDDGKPTGKLTRKPIDADEVLAFRDYGSHVVVVTKDGQKFSGDKKAVK